MDLDKLIKDQQDIQKKKSSLISEQRSLHSFLMFDAYHKIDFKSWAQEVVHLEKDLNELKKDVRLNQLIRQLEDLDAQIKRLESEADKHNKEYGKLEGKISIALTQLDECKLMIKNEDLVSYQPIFDKIENMFHFTLVGLDYSNIWFTTLAVLANTRSKDFSTN